MKWLWMAALVALAGCLDSDAPIKTDDEGTQEYTPDLNPANWTAESRGASSGVGVIVQNDPVSSDMRTNPCGGGVSMQIDENIGAVHVELRWQNTDLDLGLSTSGPLGKYEETTSPGSIVRIYQEGNSTIRTGTVSFSASLPAGVYDNDVWGIRAIAVPHGLDGASIDPDATRPILIGC